MIANFVYDPNRLSKAVAVDHKLQSSCCRQKQSCRYEHFEVIRNGDWEMKSVKFLSKQGQANF